MSVPFVPFHSVPAALPPATPPLLPEANAQHATSDDTAYTDKQLQDLQMRKQFSGLWREARAQSAQMKEELRKRAAASLADQPTMVQQTRESPDRQEWIDYALPISDALGQGGLTRMVQATQKTGGPQAGCGDRSFEDYKTLMESRAPLSYQLVGGGDPNTTCIEKLPEFIICSDDHLLETFYDPFDWPKQILDYRNISDLWTESPHKGSCALWWKIECPEPATTKDEINQQIDDALRSEAGTRTYLNQTQLHDYLDWRKANGTAKGFEYILVRDRTRPSSPAPGHAGVAPSGGSSNSQGSSDGARAIFFAIMASFAALAAGGAICVSRRFYQTAAPTAVPTAGPSASPTVATTLPSGLAATTAAVSATATTTVQATSPGSMASASTTISPIGAAPQPGPSSTASVALNAAPSGSSGSDDASGTGAAAFALDIPPAGLEPDA